jgi:hypothetical protein
MAQYRTLEEWNTRFGKSIRVVTRDERGRMVDQVSLASLV